MEYETTCLFVYGTLLLPENKFGAYLIANGQFSGKGKFKGILYDLGTYPGVIATEDEAWVQGSIYELNDISATLKVLDDYEGFGPGYEEPNLFVRKLDCVYTDEGVINCWVYLYNLPVSENKRITSGDYLGYLSTEGK